MQNFQSPKYPHQRSEPAHTYSVYGICIQSEMPLPLPEDPHNSLGTIKLETASADWFSEATRDAEITDSAASWYEYGRLNDGSSYARWDNVGEFFVSADGNVITCRPFDSNTLESFQVYLLGQALSFALVKQGFEPLHATAVVIENEAIAFFGEPGRGKSTLAAFFLSKGHQLLTDDLLILQRSEARLIAYPGPARIKLFPHLARRFLGDDSKGVRVNPFTRKLILPLDESRFCSTRVPVRAIYTLELDMESADSLIRIKSLGAREAFMELVKNTFNYKIRDAERLERQFNKNGALAQAGTVRRLSYPRHLERLKDVYQAISHDLVAEETAKG